MQTSASITDLVTALAAAQTTMKPAPFDATNPHFKSKYASLASVIDTTRILARHGIAVVQSSALTERGVSVTTRILLGEQWIESDPFTVPVDKASAHGVVSANTYGRRVSLATLVVVSADDDDDGNAAVAHTPAFDEAGYQDWLANLALSAPAGTFDDLVSVVKAGKPDFQNALRADKKAWTALKGAVQA